MEETKKDKVVKKLRITFNIVLGMAIVVIFGWFWLTSRIQITELEEELAYHNSGLETEVRHILKTQDSFYLTLVMEPLSWAIRNELLNGNVEKINQYLTQFVKEPKIEKLLVIDNDGIVIAATDKKSRRTRFRTTLSGVFLA